HDSAIPIALRMVVHVAAGGDYAHVRRDLPPEAAIANDPFDAVHRVVPLRLIANLLMFMRATGDELPRRHNVVAVFPEEHVAVGRTGIADVGRRTISGQIDKDSVLLLFAFTPDANAATVSSVESALLIPERIDVHEHLCRRLTESPARAVFGADRCD